MLYFAVNQIFFKMARENKLPYLQSTDNGYHTKIVEDLGDRYKYKSSRQRTQPKREQTLLNADK